MVSTIVWNSKPNVRVPSLDNIIILATFIPILLHLSRIEYYDQYVELGNADFGKTSSSFTWITPAG